MMQLHNKGNVVFFLSRGVKELLHVWEGANRVSLLMEEDFSPAGRSTAVPQCKILEAAVSFRWLLPFEWQETPADGLRSSCGYHTDGSI